VSELPIKYESAFGGLLQDIGKAMQRAHGSLREMDDRVRQRESVILPTDGRGGYTHKHALWTEAFFQRMEDEGLRFPGGINLVRVRDMAVFHHRPEETGALGWLSAKADRYSSGMDRMPRQEQSDTGDAKAWDTFRKTPLRSVFSLVDLGLGHAERNSYGLDELIADERLMPAQDPQNTAPMPVAYRRLWEAFWQDFRKLCEADLSVELFEEGLLGLLERYTWAVPSSTVDIPDISLYDHSRTVAAIAAVLHDFHQDQGTLQDEHAVKDDRMPKFRLVAGDLSGIQSTLFRLEAQGVRGVGKILRARSFLLGTLTEAAALRLLHALQLPLSCLIQQAGGRFLALVPASPLVEDVVTTLQAEFDAVLSARYSGGLALNLALGAPFGGEGFKAERFVAILDQLGDAIEEKKQRPLQFVRQGVLKPSREYEHGVCPMCGIRPAAAGPEAEARDRYCSTCADEHRLGAALTQARFIAWGDGRLNYRAEQIDVLGLRLAISRQAPERGAQQGLLSLRQFEGERSFPWPWRHLANYVPRFRSPDEVLDPIFDGYHDESEKPRAGDAKTFAEIAATARECDAEGRYRGKDFLGVLKADVDRLGFVFAAGLRRGENQLTLSRFVTLSRMLDLYFTGVLQHLIEARFPNTYTVYAGGDDLLLVGPWRQMLALSVELDASFRAYTGHNPNITLSAGLELVHLDLPINRAVEAAEEKLEQAKNEGRNRVCAIIDESLPWATLARALSEDAEFIHAELTHPRAPASVSLVYRMLQFVDDARHCHGLAGRDAALVGVDPARANWRARLGYHLARNVRDTARRHEWLTRLGFADPAEAERRILTWRLPLTIALYRNRT
jgi:CRISPR-associated protein Csm1